MVWSKTATNGGSRFNCMAYAPTRPKVLHVGAKAGQLLVPVRRMDLKPWVSHSTEQVHAGNAMLSTCWDGCCPPHQPLLKALLPIAKKVIHAIPVLSVLILSLSQMPRPPTLSLLSVHSGESINLRNKKALKILII